VPIERLSVGAILVSREVAAPAGTAGAIVEDASGIRYLLSSNHVLYLNGAVLRATDRAVVVSPAVTGSRVVAVVCEIPEFCRLTGGRSNAGDFAIAELTAWGFRMGADGMPQLRHRLPIAGSRAVGERVWKAGAATGVTVGRVRSGSYGFSLWYDSMNARFQFANQLLIESDVAGEPFSQPGDSGALVVTEDGAAAGIVCAQTARGTVVSPLVELFESRDLHFVVQA
jgi:hypothetical protein